MGAESTARPRGYLAPGCGRWSQAAPGSSARTSSTLCVERGDEVVVARRPLRGPARRTSTPPWPPGRARRGRHRRSGGGRRRVRRRLPGAGLPPCRADRRAPVGGGPGLRPRPERRRHDQPAGGRAPGRGPTVPVHLHGRRDLRRGRGPRPAASRGCRAATRRPIRPGKLAAEGLRRPLRATPRPVGGRRCGSATCTAPGRTRTARRAWLRSSAARCSTAPRRRCSATGSRRATTSTSATSWPPSSPRPGPRRPGPSTSARAARPTSSTSARRSPPPVRRRVLARDGTRPRRRGAADRDRLGAGRGGAGLARGDRARGRPRAHGALGTGRGLRRG